MPDERSADDGDDLAEALVQKLIPFTGGAAHAREVLFRAGLLDTPAPPEGVAPRPGSPQHLLSVLEVAIAYLNEQK